MPSLLFIPVRICVVVLLVGGGSACVRGDLAGPSAKVASCVEEPAQRGQIVAQVGAVPVTSAQIARRIVAQGNGAGEALSDSQLRALVDDEVRFELLVRAALARGLQHDPEVVAMARKVMVRKLMEHDLDGQGRRVSEARLRAFYRRNLHYYRQPEMRRLLHIQLPGTTVGFGRASGLINRLKRGFDEARFESLARTYDANHNGDSDRDDDAANLSRLPAGFLAKGEVEKAMGRAFAQEVFALEPGSLALAPVQSKHGWHVVWVVARRPAHVRAFDSVRDEVRDKLERRDRTTAFEAYLGELKERHPVVVYAERFGLVREALAEALRLSLEAPAHGGQDDG